MNDNCGDDDDDGDVEIEDDDNDDDGGDSIDDEGNFVDGITANGDLSNVKHLIGETQWCFLKQKFLQIRCYFKWRNNIYILYNNIRAERLQSYTKQ